MAGRLSSMRTIECLLTGVRDQLEADGCILEPSTDHSTVISPDRLESGDYVKIRLWLPNETQAITISLAEIQWIKGNWLAIEAIQMSHQERLKLRQFVQAAQPDSLTQPTVRSDQVLVRA
ncbi:MAG: hypothetical protein ACT4O4_09580 [Nitrospiraceae bacterium]